MNNYLLYSIINLNSNLRKKKIKIVSKNYQKIISFLNILWIKNLIFGYILKKNNLIIYMKFYNNNHILTSLVLISKPSYKIFIPYIKLKFLVKNIKNIYILSNFNGIFSHDFALKYKIGGLLVCKINI